MGSLIRALGSLAQPCTLVRSELNGLIDYPDWSWNPLWQNWFREQDYAAMKDQKKNELCWYFSNSTCEKGDKCPWRHEKSDATDCFPNDRCWYFSNSTCYKGDTCTWRHEKVDAADSAHLLA